MDFDLARLCRLAPVDSDLHDAVAVLRLDALRIDILRQADHPAEFSAEAFLPVICCLLADRDVAFSGDGQQALLDGNVELLGIDPRGEQIHVHLFGCVADVDRRERAARQRADSPGAAAAELVEQRVLETSETTEHVSTSYQLFGCSSGHNVKGAGHKFKGHRHGLKGAWACLQTPLKKAQAPPATELFSFSRR